MTEHELASLLRNRLKTTDLHRVAILASENHVIRNALLTLAQSEEKRVSSNALWCMTHLRKTERCWLQSLQSELIDMVLVATEISNRRMLLQLLREQEYDADSIRVDFLDFCLSKINSECEPYAIRCFSLYLAYKMCRFYPELLVELGERMELLSQQELSPGLKCAYRKIAVKL